MSELLLGCGHLREKRLFVDGLTEWENLTTLDIMESVAPDVLHNLNVLPYPFGDSEFDEIHAYEVLEHCGTQGDYRFFFAQFAEIERILKPGGHLFITCPRWDGRWAWGDPGHTRIIGFEQLVYLDKRVYKSGPKVSSMTDYSDIWSGDLQIVHIAESGDSIGWILRKGSQ